MTAAADSSLYGVAGDVGHSLEEREWEGLVERVLRVNHPHWLDHRPRWSGRTRKTHFKDFRKGQYLGSRQMNVIRYAHVKTTQPIPG